MRDDRIYIEIPKSLSLSARRSLRAHCRRVAPKVRLETYDSRTSACADWLLPAVIIISVAKPLLDGFLKELGAEGAKSLSATLKALFAEAKKRGWRSIPLHALSKKRGVVTITRPKLVRRCPILSIESETQVVVQRDTTITFVWPHTLSQADVDAALAAYPKALRAAIKSQPRVEASDHLVIFRRLFFYDRKSRGWKEHKEA